MHNSSRMDNSAVLVRNSSRIYGEGEPMVAAKRVQFVDTEPEFLVWIKLIMLVLFTYGLIVLIFVISYLIWTNSQGPKSISVGGGVMLGFFLAYIIIFAGLWWVGSSKREIMRRQVIEKELQKQREATMM